MIRATYTRRRNTVLSRLGHVGNLGTDFTPYCYDHKLYGGTVSSALCNESGAFIGWNINPWADFMSIHTPLSEALFFALSANDTTRAAADDFLRTWVRPYDLTPMPGHPDFVAWYADWVRTHFNPAAVATVPLTPAQILAGGSGSGITVTTQGGGSGSGSGAGGSGSGSGGSGGSGSGSGSGSGGSGSTEKPTGESGTGLENLSKYALPAGIGLAVLLLLMRR